MEPPFARLVDDFASATGRKLALAFTDHEDVEVVEVILDGRVHGSFGHWFPSDPEELLADVADSLQEFLSQEVWGGWPMCPVHPTHPLRATLLAGAASWVCPRGDFAVGIGQLASA